MKSLDSNLKEKIIKMFLELDKSPEVSCLHTIDPEKYDCEKDCPYDKGDFCNVPARKAGYLISELEKELGMSFDELNELAKAKRENRIIGILPCSPGDTFYRIEKKRVACRFHRLKPDKYLCETQENCLCYGTKACNARCEWIIHKIENADTETIVCNMKEIGEKVFFGENAKKEAGKAIEKLKRGEEI